MEFKNFKELVEKINKDLVEFSNNFAEKRKELNGNKYLSSKDKLFSLDENSNNKKWAINTGSEDEIQYHIAFKDEKKIIYGLGFNMQPTRSLPNPNEVTTYYLNAFLKLKDKIQELLPDYDFIYGDLEQFKNPKVGEYYLFGKIIKTENRKELYYIDDKKYNTILEDLKRQFEPYKIIFEERNSLNNQLNKK